MRQKSSPSPANGFQKTVDRRLAEGIAIARKNGLEEGIMGIAERQMLDSRYKVFQSCDGREKDTVADAIVHLVKDHPLFATAATKEKLQVLLTMLCERLCIEPKLPTKLTPDLLMRECKSPDFEDIIREIGPVYHPFPEKLMMGEQILTRAMLDRLFYCDAAPSSLVSIHLQPTKEALEKAREKILNRRLYDTPLDLLQQDALVEKMAAGPAIGYSMTHYIQEDDDNDGIHLSLLIIDEAMRRMGIAEAVIDRIIGEMMTERYITTWAHKKDDQTRNFLRMLGFEKDEVKIKAKKREGYDDGYGDDNDRDNNDADNDCSFDFAKIADVDSSTLDRFTYRPPAADMPDARTEEEWLKRVEIFERKLQAGPKKTV